MRELSMTPQAIYLREWRKANPGAVAEHTRHWRERHPGKQGEMTKAWALAHPERVRELNQAWRATHPDAGKETSRLYRDAHREELRARDRVRRAADPEKARAQSAAYRAAHPDARRKYHMDHPEETVEAALRRRARIRGAFVEDVSRLWVLEEADGICALCGDDVDPTDWHLDHIIPLAKGGWHGYDNVQVSHPLCNRQKATGV